MGLVSGGQNGRRFRITTELPEGFRDRFIESMNEFSFQPNPDATDKEPIRGWVDLFEPANTHFELNTFLFDRYLAMSLRTDKKTVNGRYAKIALFDRTQQVLEERELEKLSKDETEALQEAVEAELFARALPSVSTCDVCWDINTNEVIIFGTSDSQVEAVTEIFEATFDVRLRPERMCDWLADKFTWDEIIQRTEAHLDARGGAGTAGIVDGWRGDDPLEGAEFHLASDFITWLWLQSEASDGLFRVIDGDAINTVVEEVQDDWNDVTESLKRADLTLWLENKLKLQKIDADDDEVPETTILLGAAPTTSDNARRDLHIGKRPVEAALGMKLDSLNISMTLSATEMGLAISSLKLPFEVKKGTDEKIFERMMLLEMVHNTLKQLFQQFFLARTSPAWNERVNAWITDEILAAK